MTNQNWNSNAPQDPPNYGQVPADDGSVPTFEPPAPAAYPPAGAPGYTPPAPADQGGYAPYTPAAGAPGGYTPPAPGGYGPPAEAGYSAPAGGSYPPPAAGGYTPPVGGYSAPAGGSYTPPAAGGYPTPSPYAAPGDPNAAATQGYGAPQPPYQDLGGYQPAYPTATLAEWPKRALGGLIDYAIPGILYSVLSSPFQAKYDFLTNTTTPGNGLIVAVLWVAWVGFLAYNSFYLGGTTGYSIGRRVAKVKLVDEGTGQPIGPLKAFLRGIAHAVDSLLCFVGWLFPLWDAKKQTLADKIMQTVVINGDGQN